MSQSKLWIVPTLLVLTGCSVPGLTPAPSPAPSEEPTPVASETPSATPTPTWATPTPSDTASELPNSTATPTPEAPRPVVVPDEQSYELARLVLDGGKTTSTTIRKPNTGKTLAVVAQCEGARASSFAYELRVDGKMLVGSTLTCGSDGLSVNTTAPNMSGTPRLELVATQDNNVDLAFAVVIPEERLNAFMTTLDRAASSSQTASPSPSAPVTSSASATPSTTPSGTPSADSSSPSPASTATNR